MKQIAVTSLSRFVKAWLTCGWFHFAGSAYGLFFLVMFIGTPWLHGQVTGMQDLFTYTTSDITNHAPTTGSGKWTTLYRNGANGTSVISTNGSAALLSTNAGTVGSGDAVANYAFTPAANTIYTLETTWSFISTNNSGIGCFVASGFSNNTGGGNVSTNNGPWVLVNPLAGSEHNALAWGEKGHTALGYSDIPAADYSSPIVITQTWNTATGQLQYYINGVLQSAWTTTTTAPSGTYYAFMQAVNTGNLVNCLNMTLYAQEITSLQMQDNFTYNTGTNNITGYAPTTTPGGWGTWSTNLSSGGSIVTNGTGALMNTGSIGGGSVTASYGFTPFTDTIYTATATFNFTSIANTDCWAGIGFSSSGTNHAPWMLIRPQANPGANGVVAAESNGAGWTGNSATVPAADYSGSITATVVWNTSTGVAQFYVDNLLVLTTPAGSEYVPNGNCDIFFQGFKVGNIVNVPNIALLSQNTATSLNWLSTDITFNDFLSLIATPNTQWPTAQGHIQVLQLGNLNDYQMPAANFKGSPTELALEKAFTYCHNNNIKVAMAAYGLQKDVNIAGCGGGEGYDTLSTQAEDLQNITTAIADNGGIGSVDYIFFDGPLHSGVFISAYGQGGYGCGLTVDQAASETASVIELVLKYFPNAQFIEDESVTIPALYLSSENEFEQAVASDVNTTLNITNFSFAGFQTDMDWRTDPYSALSPLLPILAQNHIPSFGIIFNSGGWWNTPLRSQNNVQDMLALEENIQEFNSSGLPNPLGTANFASWSTAPDGTIGVYSTSGGTVNAGLVSTLTGPTGIALSGSNLYVINAVENEIGEYTTSGTTVNAALIAKEGYWATSLAVAGTNLFVANGRANTIGEYTTSGATVNASLISGLHNATGVVVSGSNLFVLNEDTGTVGEYTTAGATVNAALITGLSSPAGIAISGSNLFIANTGNGTIGEYTTAGATVNAALISGLNFAPNVPVGIAVSGSNIFVTGGSGTPGGGTIGEYTTAGATVNAALVSGLNEPSGLVISGSDLFVAINNGRGNLPSNLLPETTFGTSTNEINFYFGSPMAYQPPPNVLDWMYNPTTKTNYFATSYPDITTLVANGWIDEGAANWSGGVGGIEPAPDCAPNLVPYYEYTNLSQGYTQYAYSTSPASGQEGGQLKLQGYGSPALKGYVFANSDSADGGVPLYEFYNSTLNGYYYSTTNTSPPSGYSLVTTYQPQGISCYVTPRFAPAPGYIWELPAGRPSYSPAPGTYTGTQTVTLTSTTAGATIYYTTNGSMPTTSSASVPSGGTVTVGASETLNAIAVVTGYNNSQMQSGIYTIH